MKFWLSVILELSSEKPPERYGKFGFLDRVTESPPENAIFLVPFHLEPIYGMGLSKPAEAPLHPTGLLSCLHHFSMSNYFWPIHWSIIYFLLYMNIQITAKPLAMHKTFKYIQSSQKIWWLIITFLARIVSSWGCPTHFKTGTVRSYPKAYQLLHGARALQPSERLADIFGEALEGTLVAVKQPLLRCLVKRTWATWGGPWNCGTVKL